MENENPGSKPKPAGAFTKFELAVILIQLVVAVSAVLVHGTERCGHHSLSGSFILLSFPVSIFAFFTGMHLVSRLARAEKIIGVFYILAVCLLAVVPLLNLGIFELCPPDVCTMPAGMSCSRDYISPETSLLNLTLVNGLQKTIIVTGISCTKKADQFEPCDSARCFGYLNDGVSVPLGSSFRVLITCNDETGKPVRFNLGDYYNGRINVQYYYKDEGPGKIKDITGGINNQIS